MGTKTDENIRRIQVEVTSSTLEIAAPYRVVGGPPLVEAKTIKVAVTSSTLEFAVPYYKLEG